MKAEGSNLPLSSDNAEPLVWLEENIEKQISGFKERRKFYRRGTYGFTLTLAGLSAITTILIGISQSYSVKELSVAALVTSGMTSFITVWESLYAYRSRWINNNETLMQLYELRDDLKFQQVSSHHQVTPEQIQALYEQYKKILKSANEKWREDRTKK